MSLTIRSNNLSSCNFRKIFYFFHQYWEIVNKRGVEYSDLQVTIATSFIFDILRVEWKENGWDVEELKYVCLALDAFCDELNPNNFIYCQSAYLEQLENYYLQNNG